MNIIKKAVERPGPTMADTDITGDYLSEMRPALHKLRDWAYPDQINHALYSAYMKQSHDVGGEPDAPGIFEEKEEEQWELNSFVDCEVLGWRGIWTTEERIRTHDVLWAPVLRSLVVVDRQDPYGKAVHHARRVGRTSPLGARESSWPNYPKSPRGPAKVDWKREDRRAEPAPQRGRR